MREEFLYLCDRNACEICNPECYHTFDLSHALNFTHEPTEEEKANDTMKIPYSRGLDVTVGPGKIEAKFSENLKEEE